MRRTLSTVIVILLCISAFAGCKKPVPRFEPPTSKGLSSVRVLSSPDGYDYSFTGDAAKEIVDYFASLNLISNFTENPNEYGGMTWVVTISYDNGTSETLYHFGNMFVSRENGPWYKMNFNEAARFDALLAGASNNFNTNSGIYDDKDFEPGVILLGLKEPYKGDIRELFPELSIAEVEDRNLELYEMIKDQTDRTELIENVQSKIGTEFVIRLTENTKEAVLAGVAAIQNDPRIEYAHPNYVVEPAELP